MGRFPVFELLNKTVKTIKIGNLNFEATYWEAVIIVLLLFFLVFTLARMRFLYVHWSLGRHAFAMLFWGIVLTIIVEGFFMLSGRTLFTEILGMKKVPKPFSTILDIGRSKMVNVLGDEYKVPDTGAESKLNSDEMYSLYKIMDPEESQKLRETICLP